MRKRFFIHIFIMLILEHLYEYARFPGNSMFSPYYKVDELFPILVEQFSSKKSTMLDEPPEYPEEGPVLRGSYTDPNLYLFNHTKQRNYHAARAEVFAARVLRDLELDAPEVIAECTTGAKCQVTSRKIIGTSFAHFIRDRVSQQEFKHYMYIYNPRADLIPRFGFNMADFQTCLLFDRIFGNWDRHIYNFVVDSGKIYPIDHDRIAAELNSPTPSTGEVVALDAAAVKRFLEYNPSMELFVSYGMLEREARVYLYNLEALKRWLSDNKPNDATVQDAFEKPKYFNRAVYEEIDLYGKSMSKQCYRLECWHKLAEMRKTKKFQLLSDEEHSQASRIAIEDQIRSALRFVY